MRAFLPSPVVGAVAGLTALASLVILQGCTEDPLTGLDPDEAPGASPSTVEERLDVADLPLWRDTTLVGFAVALEVPFGLLTEGAELQSRIIGLAEPADFAIAGPDTLEIQAFVSGALSVRLDTVRSEMPSAFPATVRLHALERGFDLRDASWVEAAPGEPWTTPGGDLGELLTTGELEAESDSIRFDLPGADTLLEMWKETEGEPGFAMVVDDPDVLLRVTGVRLTYEVEVEEREDPLRQFTTTTWIFIYQPPQPEPGTALRVGGVPAARSYIAFRPPAVIGGASLFGSTVNKAEIELFPLDAPAPPFALEREVAGRPVRLAADPFEFGIKTPIAEPAPRPVAFLPDSLAAGQPIRIDVTDLVQGYANLDDDVGEEVRIGVRSEPDGLSFGFWEFGSVEAPEGLRPELRIIVTPPPEFGNP